MITVFVRRVLPVLGLTGVIIGLVRRIHVDTPASDMWFHLRMGHDFLDGWSIRDPGHLGAFDSAEWSPTQWLSQMAMAATENAFGLTGVLFIAGTVQVALILLVYILCRREAAPLPAAVATALCFLAFSIGLSPRPQILSYLLVVVTVFAWLATAKDGRARWWLVAIAWVWAPLHGMWPLAAVTGAVCVVGIALDRRFDRAVVIRLALIPALSAVVPILTPLGLDLYRAVFAVGGRSEYFEEWGPTDFHEPHAVMLALMLAITVVYLARGQRSWLTILMVLMAAGWAIYSSRTTPVAAAIVVPFVAQAIQSVVPPGNSISRGEGMAAAGAGLIGLVFLGFVAPSRADEQVVPTWTDDRLAALPNESRVLNDWVNGPYLLWRHPELSVVMHGYGDVFTDEEIKRNKEIMVLDPGWDREVEQLDVDAALVHADSPLGYALTHHDHWTVVEEDENFVYLVPRG